MAVPTGPRRTLVTFQAPGEAADSHGQMEPTWTDVATVWCFRQQAKGRAYDNAGQVKELATHVLETAYHPALTTVTPLHRVVLPGGKVCGIIRVDDVNDMHQHFVIYCIELTAAESA